jgi:glycosyltransferase involved in cell wall biosynthesis
MRDGYIPKEERKTLLFLADDMRLHSGIGNMTKELILGMAHRFNFIHVGGALQHPEAGKVLDISADVNKQLGIEDASILIYAVNGYGDQNLVRLIMDRHSIDGIIHFTDPRYWVWLYQMSSELRQEAPIIYYHIWDDLPAPLYNRPYYESCDLLLGISQQSYTISKMVLGEGNYVDVNKRAAVKDAEYKRPVPKVAYVPHGINTQTYKPLKSADYEQLQHYIFKGNKPNFVALYNSRNIGRKMTSDLILGFKVFLDELKAAKASTDGVYLLLHTDPVDQHGTDLPITVEHLCPEYTDNIIIHSDKVSTDHLNQIYNMADVVVSIGSNEGWGLSSTEALVTGTPIINNVTGGLQDQLRFEDENGNWLELTPDMPTNHAGHSKRYGTWGTALFPATRSLKGSPPTPYIFDDRISWEALSVALLEWYGYSKEERQKLGERGKEWATGDEARFTAKHMADDFAYYVNELLDRWEPIPRYTIYNVEEEIERHKNKKVGILKTNRY